MHPSHGLHKFLEHIVILCFERRFSKQNSVIRVKSNILPPPQIFGLATPLYCIYSSVCCYLQIGILHACVCKYISTAISNILT